jgi:hypothetical protein
MAETLLNLQIYNKALRASMNSLLESPSFPENYLTIALIYATQKKWNFADRWLKTALSIPPPRTTLVSSPKELQIRALEVAYHIALNARKIDDIHDTAKQMYELLPGNPEMERRYKEALSFKEQRETTRAFIGLTKYLEASGEIAKIKPLMMAAPGIIATNPFVAGAKQRYFPPKVWGEDEITIYCGPGFETWSPKHLESAEGTFIGGSEEAVIYLSKELAELGWRVTVYGNPGDGVGKYYDNKVEFLPYYEFNEADTFNIFVSWRQPHIADWNLNTKKFYVWCHDIQNPLDYTPQRLAKIDKVIVLSPWHRENIPDVPDEQVLISANGITL